MVIEMALYKKNNYGGNSNRRDAGYYNNRTDRQPNPKPYDNASQETDFSEILDYLKKPEDIKKYNLFNIDGKIKETFKNSKGGSQMRKFYDSIVDISDNNSDMEVSKGRLAMILPVAYYANKRHFLEKDLFDFIRKSIKQLNNIENADEFKKSLEAFKDVFQAVVAYTKEDRS